jgi:hypothetical protein
VTRDDLLHRADKFEELGKSLIDQAKIIRKRSSEPDPNQALWCDIGTSISTITEVLLAERKHRLRHQDALLLGGPGWDMLLFLFKATSSGDLVTADQVCRSSGTFPCTARRWLAVLVDEGLVEIGNDARSDETAPIRLTGLGQVRVTEALIGMQGEFLKHGWQAFGITR